MTFTDPILQKLVEKYPAPKFVDKSDKLFEALIESIVSQQLSVKAADTIFGRFKNLFKENLKRGGATGPDERSEQVTCLTGVEPPVRVPVMSLRVKPSERGEERQDPEVISNHFPLPNEILEMEDQKIRDAGLSFQKISYIKSVADAFVSDLIDIEKIRKMPDVEVISALTQIRGVGKWTAEMILIFTLNRPDVFSIGDLGIRNAITRLYGIKDQKEMLELSEKWAPNRSTACWYLWRSLENN